MIHREPVKWWGYGRDSLWTIGSYREPLSSTVWTLHCESYSKKWSARCSAKTSSSGTINAIWLVLNSTIKIYVISTDFNILAAETTDFWRRIISNSGFKLHYRCPFEIYIGLDKLDLFIPTRVHNISATRLCVIYEKWYWKKWEQNVGWVWSHDCCFNVEKL